MFRDGRRFKLLPRVVLTVWLRFDKMIDRVHTDSTTQHNPGKPSRLPGSRLGSQEKYISTTMSQLGQVVSRGLAMADLMFTRAGQRIS